MKGKAIGYTRVSTGHQANSGLGIEAQEAAIRRFCDYKELELIYIYEDPGESGSVMLKNRPSGSALWERLEESEDEPWTLHLVASKLDRFWRNVSYMSVELSELERLKVNVHTAGDGRSLLAGDEDPQAQSYSRLFNYFIATVDELERIRRSEQTAEALNAKRARGQHLGNAPFGFHVLKSDGKLYPLEREQVVLGMIWHFASVRGMTHADVARKLNRLRKPPRASERWSKRTVQLQFARLRDSEELRASALEAFEIHLEAEAARPTY